MPITRDKTMDPSLGEPTAQNASSIEDNKEEEAEQDYLGPNRWWLASTAFPLVAGTFGPMASAFNVCALVGSWRASAPPSGTGGQGDEVADPKWLIAANVVSLVFALVANMSLLLNMANRLSFSVAQPIAIIGWYISSFLLIVLVALAASILRLPPPDFIFTQAYYYAIMAAIIYFSISSLLVITAVGAYGGHYPREFKLTISQRTLMLQTISFLVYLLSGAAVFAHVEGWKFLDAVYWADFTLLTVGIGDYAPKTHTGRSLLFPYAIGGILILGLVIGSIRSFVLEKGKKRLSVRMVEKERVRTLIKLNNGDNRVLVPIQSEKASSSSKSTALERKEEFELMRKVQHQAFRRRRWTSLLISAVAWFVLWLLGALVFKRLERSQPWSYFQSLYFAYTSLLTIGYGDLYPTSNSGKPFFVFWSLLAVPTITILISNIGDTIVEVIKELTLWIGEWTILPGESPMKEVMKKGVARVVRREKRMSEPEVDRSTDNPAKPGPDSAPHPPIPHPHHPTLLIREIRRVISHLTVHPHRKYSYDEWDYFLHLIGEGESSHHAPKAKDAGHNASLDEAAKWSWLGRGSPLMAKKSEPEWVLERLVERLERWLEGRKEKEL